MAKALLLGLPLVLGLCGNSLQSPVSSLESSNMAACTERQHKEQWVCADLIILPVGADKRAMKRQDFQLTDFLHGVRFDLNGDGVEEQVAWTAEGSHLAFLGMDRNGNGTIDNGKELFSNFTTQGWFGGFHALTMENNQSQIPERQREMAAGYNNPVYEKLLLWEDDNHDGLSQPEEIRKFSDEYLAIDAIAERDAMIDKWGNEYRSRCAAAVKEPGMTRMPYGRRDLYIPIYAVVLRGR